MKQFWLIVVALFLSGRILGAAVTDCPFAASQPAEPEITTPRLTPVPVMVAGVEQTRVDLTGMWRFAATAPEEFWAVPASTDQGWSDIKVPGEWVMQGFEVQAGKAAAYRRMVALPASWRDQRIKLRFDAVYSQATVYMNGKLAGTHEGGFTPFELDVTDVARPGEDNVIAVGVRADSPADLLSHGSKYASHCLGGISRKGYLFCVPRVNASDCHVWTTFDAHYRDGHAHVLVNWANETGQEVQGGHLRVVIAQEDGGEPVASKEMALPHMHVGGQANTSLELVVPNVRKWDCEHPNLYTLECSVVSEGKTIETIRRRFGFRQVEVRGNQILINNMPVKLRGINRHEVDPLGGRSLSDHLWRKDAELYRAANINYVRTSHYPPAEEFIEACDELGLFVGEEAPFCFMGMTWGNETWKTENAHDPKYRELVVRQTLEMVRRDRSHPSVIIWSLANESMWGPSFEASARAVAAMDPTRPREFSALPWEAVWNRPDEPFCQIGADHYPGQGGPDKYADYHRPILFDEYCHLNAYEKQETGTDPGVREEWVRPFERMWEKMYAAPGVAGGSIWAGISDAFHLPSGKVVGITGWGPIDEWRRPQPEYWHIKKVYAPIRVELTGGLLPGSNDSVVLRVQNRHDFSNLSEMQIAWAAGGQLGTVCADVAPQSWGELVIPVKTSELKSGDTLRVTFTSPRGFVVDECVLPLSVRMQKSVDALPATAGSAPVMEESPDTITISGAGFRWVIDRKAGQIRSGETEGTPVMIGGPTLMLLPYAGARQAAGGTNADEYVVNGLLNKTCSDWKAEQVTTHREPQRVAVQVLGAWKQARGGYTIKVDAAGSLSVYYFLRSEVAMNPRQMGMVFDLPRSLDTLAWKRHARWTGYPEDHIGRPEGAAHALRDQSWPEILDRTSPPWPWSLDSNALGTADFRSTRTDVLWASLKNSQGRGVQLQGDGRQAVRCWLDGDRVRMLVAGFSKGSGEPYLNRWGRHFQDEHRILEKDSAIEDTMRFIFSK